MALHKDLTGSDLHEPKGISGASAGTVYKASGAGSGTWGAVEADEVSIADTNSVFTGTDVEAALSELYEGHYISNGVFADVSSAETLLIPIPFDCTVTKIVFILQNGITVANSIVTVTRADGAAMGSKTITQSGSAEGTTFEFTPTGNADFTYSSHKYVKLVSDGGSTTTSKLYVQVHMTRS